MGNFFSEPEFTSRQLLIFNHNPKAGGGTILEVLRAFKDECNEDWHDTSNDANIDSSCFVHIHEPDLSDYNDRKRGFVISSIREPCSHYLSLWAFGSAGNGGLRHSKLLSNETSSHYGQDGPSFSSDADVTRFNKWMHAAEIRGLLRERFVMSYGEFMPEIDCWIFVEDFQSSFVKCLAMYQEQGGTVDWEAKEVRELVLAAQKKQDEAGRLLKEASKQNITGNPQLSHHAPCNTYFDEALSNFVETGPERNIYEMFGYPGCCQREHHLNYDFLESLRRPALEQLGQLSAVGTNVKSHNRFVPDIHNTIIAALATLNVILLLIILAKKSDGTKKIINAQEVTNLIEESPETRL